MKRSKKNKNTTQQTVVGEIKRAGQRGHSPGRRLLLRVSQRCPQFAIHTGTSPGCFGELGRNRESINPLRESPPPVPGRRIRRAPAPPGGTAAVLAAGAGREIKLIKNKAESGGGGVAASKPLPYEIRSACRGGRRRRAPGAGLNAEQTRLQPPPPPPFPRRLPSPEPPLLLPPPPLRYHHHRRRRGESPAQERGRRQRAAVAI